MDHKPKVHVYLLCYNEEAIIESIIKYYSTFCTKIFIVDNYSNDSSVSIARGFDNTTIIQWKTVDDKIDDKMHVKLKTGTYKQYSRVDGKFTTEVADWIISCDMDEILYHPNILSVLEKYSEQNITVPQITGFNIVDETSIDNKKPIIEQYKYAVRMPNFDKRILFSTDFDMSYSLGAHPEGDGFEYMKSTYNYKTSNEFKIALLHYKHIGMRFMDKAHEYSKKLPIEESEKYTGPGSHYLDFVNKAYIESPFLRARKKLFYDNGNIRFDDFEPISEVGGTLNNKNMILQNFIETFKNPQSETADYLRDIALFLEKINYKKEALTLIGKAKKLRVDGEYIQAIYKRLIEKNKNSDINFFMIVTYPRSGSTLIQGLINNLEGYSIRGENYNTLFHVYQAYQSLLQSKRHAKNKTAIDYPFYLAEEYKEEAFFKDMIESFIFNVIGPKDGEKNIGFKEVKYPNFEDNLIEFLDMVNKYIPNLKIIFNFRNLEDVAISAFNNNYPKDKLMKKFKKFENNCIEYNKNNPNSSVIIKYDEYTNDIQKLRGLFKLLSCDFDEAVISKVFSKQLMHCK